MKKTIYTCDKCGCSTADLEAGWIEISSNNNSLAIQNNLPNRKFDTISNYRDIHFCNPKCLMKYFVKPKEDRL